MKRIGWVAGWVGGLCLVSQAVAGTLSEGLLLHYTFDADEGVIVTDASGNGRTGTVQGATWVAEGARGGAYRFDSNEQNILADDANLPSGDAPRSIALWMKIDTNYPGGCTGMFGYGTDGYNYQFTGLGFDWRLDRDRIYFSPGGACFLTDRKVPAPGTWIHVAYTYGGNGDHHLYFNGMASDGMSELWGPVDTLLSGTLRIGGHPNGEGPDGGYVDDVRIYDRMLTAEEIAELAVPENGLVLHYAFDQNEDGLVTDASGNGRTGTVQGATWVADGARGGAYRFDNNSQVITATDAGLPSGDAPRSIALWMKIDTNYADGCTGMLGYGTDNFSRQFNGLGFDWRMDRDRVYFSPGGACFLANRRLPAPGTWIHVAYTYGGNGTHHLYVDGVPSDGMSELWGPVDTLLSGMLRIGGHPNGEGPDGGYVDDVRIYDRALSAEEIAALAVPDDEESGLLLHYAFDADESGIVTDASGHGRTAAVQGATWVADGARGGAYRFDNSSQVITATDAGLPSGDAPRSIALWVKIDRDYPGGCTGMLGYGTDNFSRQFSGLGFDWRLDRDRVYFSPGGACFLTDRKLPAPGTWIHVAYTYGGNGAHHLYIDGVPSDGMSELWGKVNTVLSGTLRLGGHPNSEGPDGGYVDDVRIYGRVLSAGEIAELAVPDEVPGSGLVLHYTFDEEEGGIVSDASGHGRTAAVNGATWVADGARGGAYRFDNIDQTITATDTGLPSGDSPRSVAAWMKIDRAYTEEKVTWMLSYGTAGFNLNDCVLGFDWRQDRDRVIFSPGGTCFLSECPLPAPGTWIHVAYTYGGNGAHHLYLDGVPSDGMSELGGPVNTLLSGLLLLGGHPESIGPDGGYLDDVRIYDRVLSAEEIAELAVPTKENPKELLLHYTFDADEGGIVTDASGNGRTGLVNGATWVADGARGGAYRFDSSEQNILADDAGLPSGDAPRSLALWMKIDTNYPGGCTGMLGYGTDNYSRQFSGLGFDWRLDRDRVYFSPGGACCLTARRVPAPGTWFHVVYTYGGNGDHHLYFNGVPSDGMSELGGPVNTLLSGVLRLGGHPNGEGPNGGYVDDVRIYGRVLSAEEIAELAGPKDETPGIGLVAHYTFDVDEGGIATDASGNGRTGTVNGATWVADGARGGAYRFDSSEQNILADDAGLPSGDAPRSLALWMKIDTNYEGGCTGMLGYGTDGYNLQFTGIGYDWRQDRDCVYFSPGGACFLTARQVPAPGTWIHVAYTYGGNGDHHWYFNGVPSDGMSELWGPVDTLLSGVLRMGGHPDGQGLDGGYLDDVRIYDRALSAEEIAGLAIPDDEESVDPGEPEPPPEFQCIAQGVDGQEEMILQWTSVPGHVYEVYWTEDLTKGFALVASDLVAEGTEMFYTNTLAGAWYGFYKVKIQE